MPREQKRDLRPLSPLSRMLLLVPFLFCAYFLLYAFAFHIPSWSHPSSHDQQPLHTLPPQETSEAPTKIPLDVWLDKEKGIAFDRLLANIAPGGRNAESAAPGSVIASPSREHPDYYFQCKSRPPTISPLQLNRHPRGPRRRHNHPDPSRHLCRRSGIRTVLQTSTYPRRLRIPPIPPPTHPQPLRHLLRPLGARRAQVPRRRLRLHRLLGKTTT